MCCKTISMGYNTKLYGKTHGNYNNGWQCIRNYPHITGHIKIKNPSVF